jgi:Tat protein secretion system quality control protein TatD with DNase activity
MDSTSSPEQLPSPKAEDKESTFHTSEIVQNLLSTLPAIPASQHKNLNDAHCHPTDHPDTLSEDDPSYGRLCAMSTRPNDQPLVFAFAERYPLTVVPFFGVHPWYAHLFYVDDVPHYDSVLKPTPTEDFIAHLPKPIRWSDYLAQLKALLISNPGAQIGEIGLDKSFRLPFHEHGKRSRGRGLSPYKTSLEHQLRIFTDQCKLAGELSRTVSIHGVQCHGLLFTTLQSLWKPHERKRKQPPTEGPLEFPPRICIHSSSLPWETMKQYLAPAVPTEVYFSFSMVINARYGQKFLDLVSAVPDERILIETDWHSEGQGRRNLLLAIARIIIHVKGWSLDLGIELLERNFQKFVYG